MNIKTFKVKQYNSTYKHILVIDDKPVLITRGEDTLSRCVAYLSDENIDLKDGKIKKILDEIKGV